MAYNLYKHNQAFQLESGEYLEEIDIAYTTYGTLNDDKSNVVWICHAFTANSDAMEWWPGMVGKGLAFDPDKHFIICANILGSAYGTTGPLSVNPKTGKPYYRNFPFITVRDIVNVNIILAGYLKIDKINTLTGGSVGGHQAIEWAIMQPGKIKNLILIATNARFSAWGNAFNASQRMAIEADPSFYDDKPEGGAKGLETARSIALISYRNQLAYNKTQSEQNNQVQDNFKAESYQRYQGKKLTNRFNAYSYYTLTKVLDAHNVARNRGGLREAMAKILANTLIVGINSDILFLPEEQYVMKQFIKKSELFMIESDYGHDGFLLEYTKISGIIANKFLQNKETIIQQKKQEDFSNQ
ncbi:MAG: homoserine O-acetyltransferase [Bacteroidetes bacterium 4572_117]|nr:MAG: homoserine O-acetyltransferase [Bacteroidetes bacterium 4572_117]